MDALFYERVRVCFGMGSFMRFLGVLDVDVFSGSIYCQSVSADLTFLL